MTRLISFDDIRHLDEPADKIAFAMARRFYWLHHLDPKAKSRFNQEEGDTVTAERAAYNAYCYYYKQLALELQHPYLDPVQLQNRILDVDNKDRSLDNVLSSPAELSNHCLVNLKHAHQVMQHNDQLAKHAAFTAYQQKMRFPFNEDQNTNDAEHLQHMLARHRQREQQANDIAFELYQDYHTTLHRDQLRATSLTGQYSLNTAMKQRLLSQHQANQALQSAWNAGYKLGTVIAYCASLLPYVYYKARYGRDAKTWQQKAIDCEQTRTTWVSNISRVVGTVFAAISFTTLILPAMLISHKTKRPSLGQNSTAQQLYRLYDHITDQKGTIKAEYEQFVQSFVRRIVQNYNNNSMTRSHSSKKLITLLQSDASSATEKMQAIIGYMTTNNTTRAAIRSAKQLLWSRDQRFGHTDTQLLYNEGKRLYCVIEEALEQIGKSPNPSQVTHKKRQREMSATSISPQTVRLRYR